MSRTIRKMLRHHNAPSVKAYKPGYWYFTHTDALKRGRPKVTTFQKTVSEKYLYKDYKFVERRRHYIDEYGKRVVYTATDYVDVWVERTRKVPNPEFNADEYEAFFDWRAIHKYVYRNKTCRRQRMNAVRHAKRAASRDQRIQSERLIRSELAAFYEEADHDSCE